MVQDHVALGHELAARYRYAPVLVTARHDHAGIVPQGAQTGGQVADGLVQAAAVRRDPD